MSTPLKVFLNYFNFKLSIKSPKGYKRIAYTCSVQSVRLSSGTNCELTSVNGIHNSGKSNDDVNLFSSGDKYFNCFPRITNFFKNIEMVILVNANLASIDKSDLQQFGGKLIYLCVSNNNLEALDSDLFEYTPNIEALNIQYTQIKYIGYGIFNKLSKIDTLAFSRNSCSSVHRFGNSAIKSFGNSASKNNCADLQALQRHKNLVQATTTTTTSTPTTTTTTTTIDPRGKP